ncbi:MAG: hypothetical protein HRT99_01005 [Mycoplasmatales bacterium]|nr:hypothetical protein [Mycoplasmatales bacterium]
MWDFWKKRKKTWTNKKIAFVSILIATSVAFVLIFTRIAPIASLPSFKLMAGGLPIKLTGYIFGPLIGAVTGAIADVLSFAITPTYIHWWYTLAFAFAGGIPGVVGYLMNRRWKNKAEIDESFKNKVDNTNFIITLIVLATIFIAIFTFVVVQGDEVFKNQKLITNKWVFLVISTSGIFSMFIATIAFRFFMKPSTINLILPIITFSALLEAINTPLTAIGDKAVWEIKDGFITILTGHLLMSPVKIWGNMLIILFAYKIVSPLIYNKTGNSWGDA